MTIPVQIPRNTYTADGVNDTFSFTFRILNNADLAVKVDGILQAEGVNYDVVNVTPLGGDIVFQAGSIPVLNSSVSIERDTSLDQNTDYVAGDPFPAETHEIALDKLTMIVQELSNVLQAVSGTGLPLDPTGVFWDALSRRIQNLPAPALATDAANKSYVDSLVGTGVDADNNETITGLWTFTQVINGLTTGNLILADLAPYTARIVAEAITGAWTFADGAGSQRKVAARNPRERLVISDDIPTQFDEGAILRVTGAITTITLEQLEPQTTFTVLADATGYTMVEGAGVTFKLFDGKGLAPPTGDQVIKRASSTQVIYESATEVTLYGNGGI